VAAALPPGQTPSRLSAASHWFADDTTWNFLHTSRRPRVRRHVIGNRAVEVLPMRRHRRLIVLLVLAVLVAVGTSVGARSRSAAAKVVITPAPFGPTGWWKPVFSDEFRGRSLDVRRWYTCFWWAATTCSIESNRELELYDAGDVSVNGGALHLQAQKRQVVGWNGVTHDYTSGMVMTGGRRGVRAAAFAFTYGYAEARVRVPKGKGLWPAFWLLPVSYDSRPEIDAMEILGDNPSAVHMHFHYADQDVGTTWTGPDFSAGWHTFGVDWEPNAIVWYVDGVERWRFTDASVIPHEPMYLLANLAVGGSWPGDPDATTPFPSSYDLDYIRVWQRSARPPSAVALIPPDASWRYLDGGSPGPRWRSVAFDDSSWGYGNAGAGTSAVTYLRRSFGVGGRGAIRRLTLEVRSAGRAVVYLDSRLVYRTSGGRASKSIAIARSRLRAGVNTLAVAVHRTGAGRTLQLALVASR
jgi:beta-glucanase (GH16 family)